jgi:inhibitor of cysteine peptidase
MIRAGVLVAACTALLAGCGDDDGVKAFDQPRGTLDVKAGEEFRVTLPENRSTGYLWRFARRPNPAVARLVDSDFELEEGGENRPGAGGTRSFRFRAGARGQTAIVLANIGPGGGRPARTLSLVVKVG